MITVQEHLCRIVDTVKRLSPVSLDLLAAQGCVLARDITSEVDLPGFTNSAMDGYAVYAADLKAASSGSPLTLPVVQDIAAGSTLSLTLLPGQSMRIMTGAPMPGGADAVVPVESTDGGLRTVVVTSSVSVGQHVREAGGDVSAGDSVMSSGTRLGPRQIALLAAVGLAEVMVTPRPRVVVISTGDELIEPGTAARFGQVVDSNSLMLTAAVRAADCVPVRVGPVPDDATTLLATIHTQLARADAVITTGGVSMGAYDTVKEVLSGMGTMRFDKVAMQPGMPQGFGLLGGQGDRQVPVFTLPGNPVSALVSFEVFVAPALRLMAGRPQQETSTVSAVAASDWAAPAAKTQFARVVLSHRRSREGQDDGAPRYSAAIAGLQSSHALGALAVANALAVIPAEVTSVRAGDHVACHPLGPVLEAT